MKSPRFPQFLILALLVFVTFGFVAVPHIQAEQIVYFPLDTDPGWSTQGQWQFGVPLGQGGTECGYLGSPSWLSGWNYCKKQTITGPTAGAQTNYQMKMTVHKGSGTDSATDVYCSGNCRDDFGDIRWTTSDGTTLMDYWIESIVSGDNAVFWIEIPSIPASPNTVDVYMYYSNSSATSVSNGANTFFFFDDFTGTSGNDINSSKWTWGGSHQAKYSTDHPRSGTTGMKLTGNNDCGGEPYHTLSATTGEAIAWLYDPGVGGGSQEAMFGQAFNSTIGIYGNSSSYYKYRIDGSYVNTSVSRTQGWRESKMRSDGNNTYFYIDGTLVATASGMGTFNRVYLGNAHNVNTTDYFDDARVRKYVSPEPTWGIWEFVPPDTLRVTAVVPPGDFIISGDQSGPFTPSTKTYELTNIGPNSFDWSAYITQTWLDIDANGGTLEPNETTTVEVRLTTEADSLPPGNYNDLITFTNVTSGSVHTRQAILQVTIAPKDIFHPVSYWKFDEGSGITAYDSAGINDGTLKNGPVWTAGKFDSALQFDGTNDYVEISGANDVSLEFTKDSNFTISLWAKPLVNTNNGYIINKMRSARQRGVFGYEIVYCPANPHFCFSSESSYIGWKDALTENNSVAADNWYHVVGVYDHNQMSIYLNGSLRGTNIFTYNTGTTFPDKNMVIGSRSYDSTIEGYFNGLIDDVRIYNYALDANEIIELYGGALRVTATVPPEDFITSGHQGGPFMPSSKTYTLTNTDSNSLDWTATKTSAWLNITPASGTLNPGDSNTVDIVINANANTLPSGTHTDTVTFTNTTSGSTQTRTVTLAVGSKNILAYIQYSDNSASGEYQNTLTAIRSVGTNFTVTEMTNYTQLSTLLPGRNVLLIPEQENTDNSTLQSIGTAWAATLQDFVNNGGVVIVCDYSAGYGILNGAGLMNITSSSDYYDQSVNVIAPDDPIAQGVPSTYIACNGSLYYTTTESRVVVQRTGYGPVVINKEIGLGNVVLIGHDYFASNANQNRIVGNAVFNLPSIHDNLSVSPVVDFNSSGYQGGPFTPSSKDYTLTNRGDGSIEWTATTMAPWLSIEPDAGTLSSSETCIVTVFLNAQANALPPGDYNDLITFTNVTSGFVQTRQAKLHVIAIPGEIKVTDTIQPPDDLNMPFGGVIVGLPQTEQITITNTDPTYELAVTDINLVSVHPTWGTSDLSITLPAAGDSPPSSGDYYIPADWAAGAKAQSQLIVQGGYKTLSDKVDVLLLASGANPTRLRTGLAAFPDINSVGYFNAASSVPTLAQLNAYDVVVVMSDYSFYNATQTGNVLADYVDGGGKVIEAVASFATGGSWELAGRFVTGNYEPFGHGPAERFAHSLGAFDNTHPIMAGVAALTDSLPAGVTLKPQAIWVASWNNGRPLVATRNENVAGINIYAFDTGSWTGDVVLLFHNAAVWLAEPGTGTAGFTLTNVPSLPAVIPPGGNITFNVIFGPTELKEYKSSVIIKSNDIDESETAVSLIGSGITDYMEVTPDANFTFAGHPGGPFVPSEQSYELWNVGSCDIEWTAVGPDWLDISPTGGSLQTGHSTTVDVWPNHNADLLAKGIYDANVVFTDTTTGKTHYRRIILNVYTDPKIWTDPHLYDVTANQGQNFTTKLTIGNTGDADLEFDLVGTGLNYTPARQEGGEPLMLRLDEKYIASLQQRDFAVPEDAPYIEGELLVRFAPDVNDFLPTSQKRGLLISAALGAKAQEKRQYKIVPGLSLVKLPAGVTVKDTLAAISSDTTILYAQPNYEYKALITIPNDVRFNELWGMHNTGQTGGTPGADINAPEAWDIATGTGSIVVAVIDTGVDYTHPDLMDNMWVNEAEFNGKPGVDDDGNGYIDDIYGYDFVNNDGNPMDDHYHGTHCAGTVGAVGDNAQGVVGVCWALKIMAVKFLNSSGSGTTANAISSIQYATEMGARVMSNSWSGTAYDQGLKDAIDAAGSAGIVFVAAAGNGNCDTDTTRCSNYPSGYDSKNIISVMATDKYDAKASFSNYGPVTVDLGAPGVDTLSCSPGSGYRLLSGTSMATPHVAGACALLLSVNPGLGYEQLKECLIQTVDTTLPGLCVSNGRMNLHRALRSVKPASWLRFEPDSGVVGSEGSQDVNVIFDANQPAGMYEGEITVYSNDPFTPESAIPIRINLLPYDWFTELFEPNDPWDPNDPYANDMNNTSIVFKPDGMGYYRMVCRQQATSFPEDPNGSIAVPLEDDDYEIVDLNGVCVSLYGKEYNRFYIGSNGYISFVSGDTSYSESLEQHFLWPRISALFDDLNPEAGGQISYKMLSDKVVVTFENVPELSMSNLNSFQVEMWFDGKIRMTWLSLGSRGGLVGLSDGTGIPAFFVESDLSSYDQCDFLCDLNRDLETDFGDFATFGQNWQRRIPRPANVAYWKFDESEGAVAYDSSGNNHNGTLENGAHFVSGIMNNAVEFDGADDRVSAGAFDVTGGDGHITIAAWIKADDFDVTDGRIISKAMGKTEKSAYWILNTTFNGRNRMRLCFSLKSNGVTETLTASSGDLMPAAWIHVAATWDGSTMRLYKDGVPVGSKAKNGILDTNGDVEVAIGNQPTGAGNKPFDGLIDDLRIYNVALSQSEIQELMYSSEEPICTECDFYPDGLVDSKDLWIFIDHWLK